MNAFAGATVAFRVDASLQIGTGHVMRCLTLAAALRAEGAACMFICRAHTGNLIVHIGQQGFEVKILPAAARPSEDAGTDGHANWLGCDWQVDANQTSTALRKHRIDWLVVDHYAIDAAWESDVGRAARHTLVIDDLADRRHHCSLLLDQNLGRSAGDYSGLLPAGCQILIGPHHALLRPEFAALRAYSLERRQKPLFQRLLISLGGVDRLNTTTALLEVLASCRLPVGLRIEVVLGVTMPWVSEVRSAASKMRSETTVHVGTNDIARMMADSDIAIGAAGATSWERCCLGLPSVVFGIAANQLGILKALDNSGAALTLPMRLDEKFPDVSRLPEVLGAAVAPERLAELSSKASALVDGLGSSRVRAAMATINFQT